MAENCGGLRVLSLVTDYEHLGKTNEMRNQYLLNELELEKVLLNEETKDLPVAVVSVAGAYRSGKSFLLNFFLRYLSATPSARSNGTWLGEKGKELSGFSWRGGSDRDTTGILLWPKPFVIMTSSGQRVAVLLMDTQGTLDGESSVRDCSTVFALSTLISSVQMYNLKTYIGENDLQNLQLFTSYGKFLMDKTGKAFQEIWFLIRDWMNELQFNYGKAGGDMYVSNKLKILPTQQNDIKELREKITSSFEKITGFLMPLPGMRIAENDFKGRPEEIHETFKTVLKELVTSLFSPESLQTKQIGGKPVTSSDLLGYFKRYVTVFNSNKLPEPVAIYTIWHIFALRGEASSGSARFALTLMKIHGMNRNIVGRYTDKTKMAENCGGLRVLSLVTDYEHLGKTNEMRNQYLLNELELEKVLLNEETKDLPVAVVSVAGAYRSGKSFLLNFFLRYLSATPSARSNGTWLGVEGKELSGFSWRAGKDRDTTGILLWPKPFVITTSSGQRVAVLLMDTQGTFDGESSVRDCSTVFALSTLISSVQMYNIKTNIGENDLQNLQLFTSYGKFLKDKTGKAFQEIWFLIRDWLNESQLYYGKAGGDMYVSDKLKILPTQQNDIKELREKITSSFEKITGFLMPLPGMRIAKNDFKGRPEEIDETFKTVLKELVTSLFSPENLQTKQIGGKPVTSSDLLGYFKRYVTVFNSNELPEPVAIYTAIAEEGLLSAEKKARSLFEKNIQCECELSMPIEYVREVHRQQLEKVRDTFTENMLFADDATVNTRIDTLVQELSQGLEALEKNNFNKTNTAIIEGIAAYDAVIRNLSNNRPLCVHVKDLETAHEQALAAATAAFNNKRKELPSEIDDPDRRRFYQDLETKYNDYQTSNELYNRTYINDEKNRYHKCMLAYCNHKPKLTEAEFHNKHEVALMDALHQFSLRRTKPNQYTEDIYKTTLEEYIIQNYNIYKQINTSMNGMLLLRAFTQYQSRSPSVSDLSSLCLHPDELKEVHAEAVNKVKALFNPNNSPDQGFDLTDPDQYILKEFIDSNFQNMLKINEESNKKAKNSAFKIYKEKFDALTNYAFYFAASWATAKNYHNEAFDVARDAFYERRRSKKIYSNDVYLSELEEECKRYYNPHDKSDFAEAYRDLMIDIEDRFGPACD